MPLTDTVERGAVIATAGVPLVVMVCGKCQCVFAIPEDLYGRARADSKVDWWCPNGHCRHFTDTLREKLARQTQATSRAESRAVFWNDQHGASERSKAATRGHLTRLRTRVAAGVCPCCNRTFKDLARHMTSKHPDYAESKP